MVSIITQVPKGFFKGKRLEIGQKKFLSMAYKDFVLFGAKGYDMGEEGKINFSLTNSWNRVPFQLQLSLLWLSIEIKI
ncbi:hypothetical protein [Ammoniphilus sp. 3BR4]|uniref:hypothetical protein n=1 Tax=Ammoniphilus sp. 3BR4 TaxID=3158265 RepID=UPI0034666695